MLDFLRANKSQTGNSLSLSYSENVFDLQNVNHYYKDFKALENINLTIKRGEIVFITGNSGAGKSTLLKILANEVNASNGEIGRDRNLFISNVFQDLRLFNNKTVKENLLTAFDNKIYKSKKDFLNDLNEVCGIFGIENRLNHKIVEINGGAKQKVALARAILTRPDILIADEPTASLDNDNAKRIFDLLNFFNEKRGLTIIWASHNSELVKKFYGRIVHLDSGKLVYSGNACFI